MRKKLDVLKLTNLSVRPLCYSIAHLHVTMFTKVSTCCAGCVNATGGDINNSIREAGIHDASMLQHTDLARRTVQPPQSSTNYRVSHCSDRRSVARWKKDSDEGGDQFCPFLLL